MITRRELWFSVITFYTVFNTMSAFLALHPVLPTLLRQIRGNRSAFNITDDNESEDAYVRHSLGLVNGCGAAMQLLSGLVSGWLPFGLTHGYILSSLICIIYPIILLIHSSLLTLCLANGLVGISLATTFILIYTIIARTIHDEKFRIRIVMICVSLSCSAAAVISYACSGTILQFCGYNALFVLILGTSLLDLGARILLHTILPTFAKNQESKNEPEVKIRKEPSNRKWISRLLVFKDPYLIILAYFRFQHGFSKASLYTTAPDWILSHIRADQWQTGVIMGASSGLEIVALLSTTVLVTSHRRRSALVVLMILTEGAGYASYPFVRDPWTLLVPEMFIRSSPAVSQALLSTLVAYIIELRALEYQSLGYSLHSVSFSLGLLLGTFSSGTLVGLITFRWFFVTLGSVALASGPLALVFKKIRPILLNIVDVNDEDDDNADERNAFKLQTDDVTVT